MAIEDQNSVDALLAQVQADTNSLQAQADAAAGGSPADAAAIAGAANTAADIAGDIAAAVAPHRADPADITGDSAAPAPAPLPASHPAEVHRLLAIEVPVIVQLGMRRMNVGEVMRLAVGAIIEFGKSADEELDLLVNNKAVGKGQAVKVGENFGIKITRIGSVKETIRKLGAA